jgi:hypothetical protein
MCVFLILPPTDLSLHRHHQQRVEQLHVLMDFLFLVLCWILLGPRHSTRLPFIILPGDARAFLCVASVGFLLAVGYVTKICCGRAAGSFAQSVALTCFLSSYLVIPDVHRLVALQAAMTLGAFACLTGMCWSARRSLGKTGTLPSRTLVSQTLLPIDDINVMIELTPISPVIVTIIGMIQSA